MPQPNNSSLASPQFNRRWARQLSFLLKTLRNGECYELLQQIGPEQLPKALVALRARLLRPLVEQGQKQIMDLLATYRDAEFVILFPPGLNWSTQLFQRPQQIAKALAQQGAVVFYIQPGLNRNEPAIHQLQERLYLCNTPLESFRSIPHLYQYLLTWNSKFEQRIPQAEILYDYLDDLSAFPGSPARLEAEHQHLLRDARLVLATSQQLYTHAHQFREDVILCPNAVEASWVVPNRLATAMNPPADLRPVLTSGRALIGYHGALAAWFDYELLDSVATARLDLEFVLIGPNQDNSLPAALLKKPNVHWLGAKSYAELPTYLQYFEVGMIPFRLNAITHATSPIKLFEYMAARKPVVATPMQEVLRYPAVLTGSDPEEFCKCLEKALQLKNDQEYLNSLQEVALENTWDSRARQILDALRSRASSQVGNPNRV